MAYGSPRTRTASCKTGSIITTERRDADRYEIEQSGSLIQFRISWNSLFDCGNWHWALLCCDRRYTIHFFPISIHSILLSISFPRPCIQPLFDFFSRMPSELNYEVTQPSSIFEPLAENKFIDIWRYEVILHFMIMHTRWIRLVPDFNFQGQSF